MRVRSATLARPGGENEDHVLVTTGFVVLLDGASVPPGGPTACVHGVRWFVTRLADELAATAVDRAVPLPTALRTALSSTAAAHGPACEPRNARAPSATVVAVRELSDGVDWLVIGDSSLVLSEASGLRTIVDDRLSRVAQRTRSVLHRRGEDDTGRWQELVDEERRERNRPDGWWIAAGDPEAAEHALTGTSNASRMLVASDGAARPVTFGEESWRTCVDVVATQGPDSWLAHVRDLERSDPDRRRWPRTKTSDDATIALIDR